MCTQIQNCSLCVDVKLIIANENLNIRMVRCVGRTFVQIFTVNFLHIFNQKFKLLPIAIKYLK